jgi:hypothetical protein
MVYVTDFQLEQYAYDGVNGRTLVNSAKDTSDATLGVTNAESTQATVFIASSIK